METAGNKEVTKTKKNRGKKGFPLIFSTETIIRSRTPVYIREANTTKK